MIGLVRASLGSVALTILYYIGRSVYRLYFHPLAKYPGPRLAAISEFWYAHMVTSGRWPWILHDAHVRYGPTIRIAPNEISFSSIQSVKDIYGPPSKSKKLFTKNPAFYDTGDAHPPVGLMVDVEQHKVRRAILQPGFQVSSLRKQESLIHEHVDTLIENLLEWQKDSPDGFVDLSLVYEWLTFDVIAHLVFGESFGAVRNGQSHPWVSILLEATHASILMALRHRLPSVNVLIKVLPWVSTDVRTMLQKLEHHQSMTLSKVRKRVEMGDIGYNDIMQSVLDEGSLSEPQLASEMMTMMVAGSETSAMTLTAATYFLGTNPLALQALKNEIRTNFTSYGSIIGDKVSNLPYLNAVIEETLRLHPPVAVGPPRISPGEFVDGTYCPAGTGVSTHMWYMHHHPELVPDPDVFDPSRWIDGPKPFTFPFNVGPYTCIGVNLAYLEMKIALAKLVFKYDFVLGEGVTMGGRRDWQGECRMQTLWKRPSLEVQVKPVEKKE